MKIRKLIQISLLLLVALTQGCDSFVTVETPNSQLTSVQVFENITTAEAAMSAVYSKLRDTGILTGGSTSVSVTMGMYADELDYYGGSVEEGLPFYNTLLPDTGVVVQNWNESYHQIYCVNALLEGLARSSGISSSDREALEGEALFVRALVHFYLYQLYGAVPYITGINYEENRLAKRIPENEVYAKIVADLEQAVLVLPENYKSDERTRANKAVANALLARVYLYNEEWAAAANAASAVLNRSEYVWETNLDHVFLKESQSIIWQFAPRYTGENTGEAASFIFTEGPPPSTALSAAVYAAFEPNDLRKANWIKSVSDGTTTWFHSFKYKESQNTGTTVECSIIFRMAEVLLIRAEARAQQGSLVGAKEDLNQVRQRAGLPGTTATTSAQIVTAVLQERRVELFTEMGHRFFDLKRMGKLDSVLGSSKSGWNSTDRLWPIPEIELSSNPNLGSQNPGY